MSVCSTACGNAFAFYLTLIQVWKKKLRYHRWQCTTVWEPLIWIFFFFWNSPAVVREAHLGVILVRLRCANNGLCGPWTRSTVSSWCMETQICPVCWMISDQGSHSDVTLDLLYFYFYFSTVTYHLLTPSFHLSALRVEAGGWRRSVPLYGRRERTSLRRLQRHRVSNC